MNLTLVRLFDVYSPLLNDRQREIMSLYYNEDESLAEIAENTGITRQGVRDWIKKTEVQLVSYEKALRLVERGDALRDQLTLLDAALASGELERARAMLSDIMS